jgi:hypothetical protein
MDKIREQNRLRKQRQRENQKLLNSVSRDSHGTVTECHDTEEEIEEEKDKEEEKEFHSFTLSGEKNVDVCSEEDKERAKLNYMGGTLGQNILLISEEQFDDLCDRMSYDELNKYIGIVVDCEKNGQHFKKKTHYQAILDMVAKDRKEKK